MEGDGLITIETINVERVIRIQKRQVDMSSLPQVVDLYADLLEAVFLVSRTPFCHDLH